VALPADRCREWTLHINDSGTRGTACPARRIR
jgi:hypothetical protein